MSTDTIPCDCKVHSVIKFLRANGVNMHEIHRRLCLMYSEDNVMSLVSVYQKTTMFKGKEQTHTMNNEKVIVRT